MSRIHRLYAGRVRWEVARGTVLSDRNNATPETILLREKNKGQSDTKTL